MTKMIVVASMSLAMAITSLAVGAGTVTAEPAYALRLFVGQESSGNRPTGSLNDWYPATTRHGYGTWRVALKKGLHPFKAIYVDYRTDAAERFNHPGMRESTIWDGNTPELLISGPGIERQPIPAGCYFLTKESSKGKDQ